MNGFFNRYLFVDMTSGRSESRHLDDDVLSACLGGKGIATRLLLDHQPAGVDPLSPDNPLIFATGPITDTAIFGSSRYGVYSKSPLTGVFLESYSGGKVPEKIGKTGYDAIVIQGRSENICLLEITPEGASVQDAPYLKGLDCHATENLLSERYGKDSGAVVTGPAAENLIPFSIISNDLWRCAGRAGGGTVMGSKNLKAIVFRGTARRPVAEPEAISLFAKKTLTEKKDHAVTNAYKIKGTPMLVDIMNDARAFPTRYWSRGFFDQYREINPGAMQRRMEISPQACAKCFMACGKLVTVKDGPRQGLRIEGPEYETIYAFGGLCMIGDITEIAYLNDLCDKHGIDTITTGNLVAFAMEASAQGKIGEEIPYGNSTAAEKLIGQIVSREGIGAILAQGIRAASREFGMEEDAIHVKGLEPAGYDPRYLKGMSLAYAVSDRGACHLRSTMYKAELSGMIKPSAIEGKASLFIDFEDRLTLFDTLVLCRFYRDFYLWDELGEIIRMTTGMNLNKDELRKKAGAVTDLVRTYNLREGVTQADDVIPGRFFREPLPEEGYAVSEAEFSALKKDYYELRGWSREGKPQS